MTESCGQPKIIRIPTDVKHSTSRGSCHGQQPVVPSGPAGSFVVIAPPRRSWILLIVRRYLARALRHLQVHLLSSRHHGARGDLFALSPRGCRRAGAGGGGARRRGEGATPCQHECQRRAAGRMQCRRQTTLLPPDVDEGGRQDVVLIGTNSSRFTTSQ